MNGRSGDPRKRAQAGVNIKGARLVGRRLEGTPDQWTPEVQHAMRAMKDQARRLGMAEEVPAVSCDPYVVKVTDEAAQRYTTDALFKAKTDAVVSVMAARRGYEGFDTNEDDYRAAIAVAALTLVMITDMEAADLQATEGGTDGTRPE